MPRKKNMKSSIPQNILEKTILEYRREGSLHYDRVTGCFLNGILVGQRLYNREDLLVLETPIKDGLKHGCEFTWGDDGTLLLTEPYLKGKIHGTAKQYGRQGKVIGTYTLIHGTGFDVWRQENQDQTIYVSEIHSLRDGRPHGYEWHFTSGQELWHERYWYLGKTHGIERIWNSKGKLRRGYPRFYILDQAVSKQKYLNATRIDKTLSAHREEENLPHRNFPPKVQELMSSSAA